MIKIKRTYLKNILQNTFINNSLNALSKISLSIIKTKEDLDKLLLTSVELNGTDLHFTVGAYPAIRINGKVKYLRTDNRITVEDVTRIASFIMPEEI